MQLDKCVFVGLWLKNRVHDTKYLSVENERQSSHIPTFWGKKITKISISLNCLKTFFQAKNGRRIRFCHFKDPQKPLETIYGKFSKIACFVRYHPLEAKIAISRGLANGRRKIILSSEAKNEEIRPNSPACFSQSSNWSRQARYRGPSNWPKSGFSAFCQNWTHR